MASTRGRAVVLALTNKSGEDVAAGDVVVVDTSNNDAFTTSTAGAVTGGVGIAQETIANNAVGRVLVHGYAALVNVNASVTRGNYGKSHTVAKQAVDAGSSRVAGVFCQFLTGGTTPTARVFSPDLGAAAGNVAADAIWDAAGDLAVGTGSDTAARLAKGAAGGVLAMGNGAVTWNAGTSFPGSPATNDRYYRTDLGMEAFWDGTRWLTTQQFEFAIPALNAMVDSGGSGLGTAAFTAGEGPIPWRGTYSIYVTRFQVQYLVATTNDGTKYWTFKLNSVDGSAAATQVGSTISTVSKAPTTWLDDFITPNSVVDSAGRHFRIRADKVSTPGNVLVTGVVTYRIVLT